MRWTQQWFSTLLGGLFLLTGCTIQQQREVLGTIGTVIPGSSTSRLPALYSSSPNNPSAPPASPASTVAAAPSPPPQTVDLVRTDAQWVLQTIQRAMTDDPTPFQDCLQKTPCQTALTTHLLQLQKKSGGTLVLPAVYDRYDLKRGQE